ncbi:hypothetical protein PPROV_000287900 [Pycnococcus provasolii]|uniref:Hemimethylated DNA-binding domain-containing protein n=1 Tax=Pycnococcus provasolii TaxID=41880 RepID=A0A830HAX2_9CHLO|nr:hypothetical protein PPROV_000287900 [Pycnococcus provasolii]
MQHGMLATFRGRLDLPRSTVSAGRRVVSFGNNVTCARRASMPVGPVGAQAEGGGGDTIQMINEHSAHANEELMLMFFQMDLDVRLQRALNLDAFDAANEIRKRRDDVDQALARLMENQPGGAARERASAKQASLDAAADGIILRGQLAQAIEEERYADAAQLRDKIAALEEAASGSSGSADELILTASRANAFVLGQTVRHAQHGYYGVVAGFDAACRESDAFLDASGASSAPRGTSQPFYLVLPDERTWMSASGGVGFGQGDVPPAVVSYVPEDMLQQCEPPPSDDDDAQAEEAEAEEDVSSSLPSLAPPAPTGVSHPYLYLLYYGADGNGNFSPTKRLKERFPDAVPIREWEQDDV